MPPPPTRPSMVMAAGLVAAMPVAIIQNRGLVPLAVVMALAALVQLRARGGQGLAMRGMVASGAVVAALALALWGVVSSAWALAPAQALAGGLRLIALTLVLALVLAAGRAMEERQARMLLAALVAGTLLGACLMLIELGFGAPLNNALRGFPEPPRLPQVTKPAATLLALLAGPATLAAFRLAGARLAIPVAVLASLAVFASESESGRLALAAAIAAGALAAAFPALARRALPVLLALVVLAGPPLLAQVSKAATRAELLPISAVHRVLIWEFAADRAAERPFIGFGMDSARSIPGGRDNVGPAELDRLGIIDPMREAFLRSAPGGASLLSLHTHSMPLQVRLELGFVGLALFALFAFFAGRAAAALPGTGAIATAAAVAAAASVVGLLSYGVWQHWWWVAVMLAVLPLGLRAWR